MSVIATDHMLVIEMSSYQNICRYQKFSVWNETSANIKNYIVLSIWLLLNNPPVIHI